MNDCLAFDEEVIGKQKYFIREYYVKRDRDTNIKVFEHAVHEPKKILNQIGDIFNEECKNLINKLIFKLIIDDVYDRSIQPLNRFVGRNNEINNKDNSIPNDAKDFSSIDKLDYNTNSNGEENNNNIEKLIICPRLENEFLDEFGNIIGEDKNKDKNLRKSKINNQEFNSNENISHQEYVLDGIQKEYYKL
jgi:hypothetical protein